jgi:hypothetical protein
MPMNIFKLYWSVSKPTNIKSYSSIWVRHQRIYEPSDLIFTGPYIRQWSHVTDEYTWHVFVGDVAPPTNIWGTALSLRARLTDGYRRDLKTGVSFFFLSPRAPFISITRPCRCLRLRLHSPRRRRRVAPSP